MSIKGLQYLGKGNGISIVLYKSYKSVILSWNKPYNFTSRDITTKEAKDYYINNYHELGVRLVEETGIHTKEEINEKAKEKIELESKLNIEDSCIVSIVKGILLKTNKETSQNMDNIDLNTILDENLELNQIKELCKKLNFNYGNRRSKSKILKELLFSKKLELLNLVT